ncbi:MAG: P-loop NTPase [Candidatus Nanohaloarchaea archaeon]
MTWAVLVTNNKGGTGKSTMAVEIAKKLRDEGYATGLMDADIDSANLATRLGCEKKVTFRDDHIIEPVEHKGMKLYSMENAFEDSAFSQSGEFFKEVIDNMINHSDWGKVDYMVVDCPPGSSDVFDELVRAFRPSIKGAISVGQPDAVDDTVRLVKVCNHNWVPIIGFIENMSGMVCHGQTVSCPGGTADDIFDDDKEANTHEVYPFGEGTIKDLAENVGGNFFGQVPLVVGDDEEITDYDNGTVERAVEAIENADEPKLPEDNTGDPSFIKNVWNIINDGIEKMNESYNIDEIQDKFGVENREPLVMKLELTDAGALSSRILDSVVLTIDDGELKPIREGKAKRKGYEIEGGMRISSQDLYDLIRGEKNALCHW